MTAGGAMSGRPGPRGLMIAASASGAGKTTVTLGLLRALADRGVRVAPAKSGPDYIDPAFHAAAAHVPSINLDAWAMSERQIRCAAAHHLVGSKTLLPETSAGLTADPLLIVEAAMGLLDGAPHAHAAEPSDALTGLGAAADLAAILNLAVILVVDARHAGQSAIAAAVGLRVLRPDLTVAGIILNGVGSERHARMIRSAADAVGLHVLGVVPRKENLKLPSRHLGLVQARETAALDAYLAGLGALVEDCVDLSAVCAASAPLHWVEGGRDPDNADGAPGLPPLGQRIAVADDEAFAFTYPHLLTRWRRAGAELSFFSPLNDDAAPSGADAIFLPGGYPELHGAKLAAARRFRASMVEHARRGTRIYGECGGFMALGEALVDADGKSWPMLGLLPLVTSFATRRMSLGYRGLTPAAGAQAVLGTASPMRGHEFHYATVVSEGKAPSLFAETSEANGSERGPMGLSLGTVGGSFAHVITTDDA